MEIILHTAPKGKVGFFYNPTITCPNCKTKNNGLFRKIIKEKFRNVEGKVLVANKGYFCIKCCCIFDSIITHD